MTVKTAYFMHLFGLIISSLAVGVSVILMYHNLGYGSLCFIFNVGIVLVNAYFADKYYTQWKDYEKRTRR